MLFDKFAAGELQKAILETVLDDLFIPFLCWLVYAVQISTACQKLGYFHLTGKVFIHNHEHTYYLQNEKLATFLHENGRKTKMNIWSRNLN